jgi:uncharacterized protein
VPTARARTDQSLKGYKVGLKRDPKGIRLKADACLVSIRLMCGVNLVDR